MIRAHSRSRLKNPSVFSPASLFAAGTQGAWFDPSDLSSMFQDDAGTVPVTATGQVVGLIRDKSGNGNHASQATAASKPILRISGGLSWLEFDGVDDFLTTTSIPFTSPLMYTSCGIRKASDATIGVVMELSANIGTNDGTFIVLAPATGAAPNFLAGFKGTIRKDRTAPSSYPAPISAVLSGNGSITAGTTRLRVNNVMVAADASGLGTGTFGSFQMFIGRRGGTTLPFVGNLYGLVVAEGTVTDAQVVLNEGFLAGNSGVVF